MIRAGQMAMNVAAGTREKKILSNLMVKSKSFLHPSTAGPNTMSAGHPEKSISVSLSQS